MMSRRKHYLTAAVIALPLGAVLLFGQAAQNPGISVRELRCEYMSNPQGIDVAKPRLSWMLGPGGNAGGQSAYRVLVATSPSLLQKDRGDLWDSGRVASAQHTWVEYVGRALASGQQVWWKVQVWSGDGKAPSWSEPASWTMGLLQASDWKGKYIGERRPEGTAEGTPLSFPWLRKTFTLAGKPARAVAYVNPLGYYELYVNGRKVDDHVLSPAVTDYSKRTLYVTHEIADYLVPGKNVVALWLGRGWYVKGHPGVIHDGPLWPPPPLFPTARQCR
jgi:alpha-L-rhamnosidase